MTDTATIVTIIAATGLIITVIRSQGKTTDQRFINLDERFKGIDQRFTDLEKVFNANFETIRVEIKQLANRPLVRP